MVHLLFDERSLLSQEQPHFPSPPLLPQHNLLFHLPSPPFTHLPRGGGDEALQELCQPCTEEMALGKEGPDGSPCNSTALCGLAALPNVH